MKTFFLNNLSRQNTCRLFILFSLLLLLAYSNSFQAAWQLDDPPNILSNTKQQITELSWNQIWDAMTATPRNPELNSLNRPTARVTLGLNWFWGQSNVTGYHVVNFLIHLGTSGLLFLVITALFATPRLRNNYHSWQITFIAITTTLFWALNPIQIQAVTYIVQRMSSLAALFSLLALLCYIKSRLHPSKIRQFFLLIGALASYVLAFLSKENASILLLTLPFLEILFFQDTSENKHTRTFLKTSGIVLCLCLLVTITVSPGIVDAILNSYANRPYTLWERILTEQRIIIFYLSLLIYPHPARFSVQHDFLISTSLISPISTVFAIGFNILLFSFALKCSRRQPLFTLAIVFFYINHLAESTFLPLELLFEHRNYLPSIFLFLPLSQFLAFILEKNKNNLLITTFVVIILATSFTTLAYATFTRNKDWRTVESLWKDAAKKSPQAARPLSSLALELGWRGEKTDANIKKALEFQERSLSLQNNNTVLEPKILGNLAALNVKMGNFNKGLSLYRQALSLEPNNILLRYNISKLLLWKGSFREAEIEILTVLDSGYQHPDYWNIFALIALWTEHPDQALIFLQRALKSAPNRPDINLHLGKSLSMLGYHKRARLFYERARDTGGRNAFLALCRIENFLLSNNIPAAKAELKFVLTQYPYPTLIRHLKPKPLNKRYSSAPLDINLLSFFISSEMVPLSDLTKDAK